MHWDRLCRPKRDGGMGFRSLRHFNLAMHGKQGWKIINAPNSLTTILLKARYFKYGSFLSANLGRNPSFV